MTHRRAQGSRQRPSGRRRWRRAGGVALLLVLAALLPLPVPVRGRPSRAYGSDKLLHLLGHAALTAALLGALEDAPGHVGGSAGDRRPVRTAAVAVVASTLFGACTERVQGRVPGRRFEWGDLAAALVGSVAAAALSTRRRRRAAGRRPVDRGRD